MRTLLLPLIASLVCAGAATAAPSDSPYRLGPTIACLKAHKILISQAAPKSLVPRGVAATAALNMSFALTTAPIDSGTIIFERTPAAAKTAAAAIVADGIARVRQIKGIDFAKAKAQIDASYSVHGNAIIEWRDWQAKPVSRRLAASCLR